MITVKTPDECSELEISKFSELLRQGGEVTSIGLDERIRRAEQLIFFWEADALQGVAAIKNPAEDYKMRIFEQAQATIEASHFMFELGWIYVTPRSRNQGLSRRLVESAIQAVTNRSLIYATSRADNYAMHQTLIRFGFSRHGEEYLSNNGDYTLELFISQPSG